MRRTNSLIILFIALVMGGIAAYLANSWLRSHSAPAPVATETATIVVANFAIPFGTPIAPDNVREIAWPADALPQGAFSHVADIVKDGRRLVLSPFVRDEPIVASKVTEPNAHASLSTIIEPGMRAVTVPVDDVRGVAGFISPGDFVDIALTRTVTAGPEAGPVSEVVLQHVKVLAIDQTSNEHQDAPKVAKLVTLEVTQEQALKILLAVNVGRLSLILRQASEVAVAPQARVGVSDLFTGEVPSSEPQAAPPVAPPPESDLRKVTVVRSMRSEEYSVPRDDR
jgi:pilus assembly protein CpaB